MKKIGRRILFILLGIFLVCVILDFIPIKFAKNLNRIQFSDRMYVCEYATATDGNWEVIATNNPHLVETIYLNVKTDEQFRNLVEMTKCSLGMPVFNHYIFYGDVKKKDVGSEHYTYWLEATDWDVVFPIQRQSIRAFYVPKSYLTIYDFNWLTLFQK
ncbi:MAG: hypothetical protein J6N52_02295 [Clostridia bacterium]|nr:hypothetical protein [Clostridia bacterium]